jgi:hypothetical protein
MHRSNASTLMPQNDKFDSTTSGGTHTLPSLAGTRTPFLLVSVMSSENETSFFWVRPTVFRFSRQAPSEMSVADVTFRHRKKPPYSSHLLPVICCPAKFDESSMISLWKLYGFPPTALLKKHCGEFPKSLRTCGEQIWYRQRH